MGYWGKGKTGLPCHASCAFSALKQIRSLGFDIALYRLILAFSKKASKAS
jgi:hypothetical protein